MNSFSFLLDEDFILEPASPEGFITPLENDVPMEKAAKPAPEEQVRITANTVKVMKAMGETVENVLQDSYDAGEHFKKGTVPTRKELAQRPGMTLHLSAMLDQYDRELVADAARVRTYLTNRLIEETDDDDPRVRLKAMELLGKITDVGAFMERREITVHNQPTESLESILKEKIERLLGKPIDGEIVK